MISVAKCRKLLPDHQSYSDAQIKEIRDFLYPLACAAVEIFNESKAGRISLSPSLLDESRNYEFEERAAIHQFDGNVSKVASERLARRELGLARSAKARRRK